MNKTMCLYKKAFALIFSAAVCFDLLLQDSATSSLPPNVTEGKKEPRRLLQSPVLGFQLTNSISRAAHTHGLKPTPSSLSSPAGSACTHTRGARFPAQPRGEISAASNRFVRKEKHTHEIHFLMRADIYQLPEIPNCQE